MAFFINVKGFYDEATENFIEDATRIGTPE